MQVKSSNIIAFFDEKSVHNEWTRELTNNPITTWDDHTITLVGLLKHSHTNHLLVVTKIKQYNWYATKKTQTTKPNNYNNDN